MKHHHPVLEHPGRWIWLPLLVPIAIGLARLHFDAEIFNLLPANLPAVQGLRLYQDNFSGARELIITLEGTKPEQVADAARRIAERLRPRTNLVAAVTWEPPWTEHPGQMAEFMAYLWFNQPPDIFNQLARRLAPDRLNTSFAAARQRLATAFSPQEIGRLSYDPLGLTQLPGAAEGAAPSFGQSQGQRLFSSPDGTFRVVYVQAQSGLRNYRQCDRWLRAIKPLVASAIPPPASQSPAPVKVGYTGRPAFVAEVAAGMKHDIIISVGGTSAVIALLFWLAHKRVKPMLWLLALLALVLASTLALGGMIYGTINVVSMGFAAILLGLAVDYAVVHYQEALAHPNLSIPQIRHAIAPSIFWAATTTITAFLVLNFGGLPGLGQLGTLVGLGVALAAGIMIFEYLPPLFPDRKEPKPPTADANAAATPPAGAVYPARVTSALVVTAAVLLFSIVVIVLLGTPGVDATANALRPRHSQTYAALDEIQKELDQAGQPLWLIVNGSSPSAVAGRLDQVQSVLAMAVSNGVVANFTLPVALWPRPEFQAANRATARQLGGEGERLRQVARTNGFAPKSLALAENMLATWRDAGAGRGVFWPTNRLSEWILNKAIARTPTNYLALGLVNGSTNAAGLAALTAQLPRRGVHLSGWELLGHAIFVRVQSNFWKVVSPMVVLVLLSLWLAFRRLPEVLLGLAALALSGFCLLACMRLAGWSWNLLDLMGIPLVLGTGVDYSLFTQLALRRYHGDLLMAYRSVGRALLLCGGTAIAAFVSLAWSSNAGMASLGRVCAVGIASNVLIAVFLLPVWWLKLAGPRR